MSQVQKNQNDNDSYMCEHMIGDGEQSTKDNSENKIGVDEDNFGALKGYESGNEEELPFSPLNDPDISKEIDNMVKDLIYHIQLDGKIRFWVDYTIQDDITFRRDKNEPDRILCIGNTSLIVREI